MENNKKDGFMCGLEGLHINYKDFKHIAKLTSLNNIKTFGELLLYCKIWDIKDIEQLYVKLFNDLKSEGLKI